ncbi:Anaphase-promoting complex subunit 2 [Aphelenchoides fujianensis]|nr:Anaphase-promoting complex subunit 2 [Aphelenchoides fujianensis]
MTAGGEEMEVEDRASFIAKHLDELDVRQFVDSIREVESIKHLGVLIRSLIKERIQPFFDRKVLEWRALDRYELGKRMPNAIFALDYLIAMIDGVEHKKFEAEMNVTAVDCMDDGFACRLFMPLVFRKAFLEKFEAPLVRAAKYHYVLCRKERAGGLGGRKAQTYVGKIKEMFETLYAFDFLREFTRSCVVLATSHVVADAVFHAARRPIAEVDVHEYKERCYEIWEWLSEKLAVNIPSAERTFFDFAHRNFIDQMCCFAFEIFIEHYPATMQLVKELRAMMKGQDWYGRDRLLQNLCETIRTRLLHVGVNTTEILTAYARSVESLILFDESFVLVHKVGDLIKKYAKTRSDTVRKIIHFITAEKPGAFASNIVQLVDRENLLNVNDEYVLLHEDAAANRWDLWQPDPADANPTESRLFRESADVFNMLVSIYDCRDLFVKEYQRLLGNNLIANGWGKQMDAEARYLNNMKKRFTEGELNQCEVMLKDIRDSAKLYTTAVVEGMKLPFTPQIVSYVFWPEVKKDLKFKHIAPFAEFAEEYRRVYEKKRHDRSIRWYNDYGSCVRMEVKVGGCVLDVETPLSFAQTLVPFLKKSSITVAELCAELEMEKSALLKRLEWWKEKGVLNALPDADEPTWTIAHSSAQMERTAKQSKCRVTNDEQQESDDEEEAEVPIEEQADSLEQYWLYTKNLLLYHSNKDPLTPAKLAQMYKMFSSPGKPTPTVEAVLLFMQRKIKQNLVVYENGAYKPDKELKSVFAG